MPDKSTFVASSFWFIKYRQLLPKWKFISPAVMSWEGKRWLSITIKWPLTRAVTTEVSNPLFLVYGLCPFCFLFFPDSFFPFLVLFVCSFSFRLLLFRVFFAVLHHYIVYTLYTWSSFSFSFLPFLFICHYSYYYYYYC